MRVLTQVEGCPCAALEGGGSGLAFRACRTAVKHAGPLPIQRANRLSELPMSFHDAFERFQRGLERRAASGDVTTADVVGLARDASLSLAEATVVLDRDWERVFLDREGRALHPDEVAERASRTIGALGLQVVWRPRGEEAFLIA